MKKLILILVAFISLVGCSKTTDLSKDENINKKLSVEELTTTYYDSEFNPMSVLEKEKKLFSKHLKDVKINYSDIKDEDKQIEALLSGEIDFIYGIKAPSIIRNADERLKVVSIYAKSPERFTIYTNEKEIKKAKDLEGKKVGVLKGSEGNELLWYYCVKENADYEKIEVVNLEEKDQLKALQNKSVDATVLGLKDSNEAENLKLNKLTDGKGIIRGALYLLTTQKYYDEHKDIITGVIEAQEEMNGYFTDKNTEVKGLVMKSLNMDEKIYNSNLSKYDFNPEITETDMDGIRRASDFLYYNGFIEHKVDASSLFIVEK